MEHSIGLEKKVVILEKKVVFLEKNVVWIYPKGMCVKVRACAKDPMLVISAGRAVSAEGVLAVHRGDAKWSCPD